MPDDLRGEPRLHDLGVELLEEQIHRPGHRRLKIAFHLRGEMLRVPPQHRHPVLVDPGRPLLPDTVEAAVEIIGGVLTNQRQIPLQILLPLRRMVFQAL
ncbi:hypothetical protein [Rhodococcus sp. USK13]|uniref:hypothetical protein n=1 Tax=Rhodococcus sp. USK13 TaxID=2806442 RepID=UPI00201608C0|nr:hypothetical protein [Rhodococcus sp. USK13]